MEIQRTNFSLARKEEDGHSRQKEEHKQCHRAMKDFMKLFLDVQWNISCLEIMFEHSVVRSSQNVIRKSIAFLSQLKIKYLC